MWVVLAAFVGVYVARQVAVVELTVVRVQGLPLNVPLPLLVKVTVPVGVWPAPAVTVAVQVVATPARTLLGLQLTLVLEVGFAPAT